MIRWYKNLYMDENVKKHPQRCKKRVMRRRPWKKSYYAVVLAQNPENSFEIIGTRQLFFRRYRYLDLCIIGLAVDYGGAVALLQRMAEDVCRAETSFEPRKYFNKDDFK